MGSPKGERLASGPENSCKRARPVGAPKGVQRVSCCRLALQQKTVLKALTFSRPFCSHFYLTNTEYTYLIDRGAETLDKQIMDKIKYFDAEKKRKVLKMIELL